MPGPSSDKLQECESSLIRVVIAEGSTDNLQVFTSILAPFAFQSPCTTRMSFFGVWSMKFSNWSYNSCLLLSGTINSGGSLTDGTAFLIAVYFPQRQLCPFCGWSNGAGTECRGKHWIQPHHWLLFVVVVVALIECYLVSVALLSRNCQSGWALSRFWPFIFSPSTLGIV